MTDADIIQKFEAEIENDPAAYERPGECVYQITAKELVRAARAIERQTLERSLSAAKDAAKTHGNAVDHIRALIDAQSGEEKAP